MEMKAISPIACRILLTAALWVLPLLLAACMPQIHEKISHNPMTLAASELRDGGLAFITPSTVTGQEEEKQAVAFIFAETLAKERLDLRIVPLAATLSAVNRSGLADKYKGMYQEYRDTGIFKKELLAEVAEATGTRFLAQLKLAGFNQNASNRLGIFGLRLIDTKSATIRLFFQIWDAKNGIIAWEAVQEMNWSEERVSEQTITLQTVIEKAAINIGQRLPR